MSYIMICRKFLKCGKIFTEMVPHCSISLTLKQLIEFGNVNVNEGKNVGLAVGDSSNCMQVDSTAPCCGCMACSAAVLLRQHVEYLLKTFSHLISDNLRPYVTHLMQLQCK